MDGRGNVDRTEGTAQGDVLAGRYRLAECLGRGGMGRVWRAHDEVLHRTVAVKELTAALYVSEADRAVLLARTQKEARAAARINHSAVVTVHDVFEYDERPWIVMELVDGGSLADALRRRQRIEPVEAARIGAWVVRALRAAHAAGVLHRDVKPANVLLAGDRRVLLTDFGIAAIEGDSTITKTGELVGSLDYLAPERVRGADPGPASDLWAVGVLLFAAVEGYSPFRRQSPLATMQAVVVDEPGVPEHAGPLAPVIAALLSKDPEVRPDADLAEQMLTEVAEGRRPSAAQEYVATRRYEAPGAHAFPGTPPAPTPGTPPTSPPGTPPTPTPVPQSAPPASPGSTVPSVQPPPQPQPPRHRWRNTVAVIVAAGLVGVGAAVGILEFADRGGEQGRNAAQNGSSGDDGEGRTEGAVPKDWVRIKDDVAGFSLLLPPDFKRRTFGDQIDYTPDNGRHLLRIGVNKVPPEENSYVHAKVMEKQGMGRLPTYERVQLESNTFRGRPGAIWEFSWTETDGVGKGERRAIDQLYIAADGTEYAIYMAGPAKDWDRTRERFEHVLRGWRP
ncbi:serine/threonine-protein kinase [Streptomyces cavernicola]|uniref:non-specific serine/threonine protein kinase n=1 Tax=Streptomyces cavernicola TaxID=3043613 RepID=A0ABT6SDH4_9ACTN|nr:serine/threonine-protein kinase [Streptomyces sp. B-S-A6]MDI3405518.1 serine/threonine-protein kinase [Streptomyces sp. B-S-A6]